MLTTTTVNNTTQIESSDTKSDLQKSGAINKKTKVKMPEKHKEQELLSLTILQLASTFMEIEFMISTPLNNNNDTDPLQPRALHHSFLIKDNKNLPENFFLVFLKELIVIGEFSKEVAILALIYAKRFIGDTGIRGKVNYQRLIGTAFFLAQKIHNDLELWYIPEFSQIVQISELTMKDLERDFCECIDYKFYVSPKEFEYTLACLELKAM